MNAAIYSIASAALNGSRGCSNFVGQASVTMVCANRLEPAFIESGGRGPTTLDSCTVLPDGIEGTDIDWPVLECTGVPSETPPAGTTMFGSTIIFACVGDDGLDSLGGSVFLNSPSADSCEVSRGFGHSASLTVLCDGNEFSGEKSCSGRVDRVNGQCYDTSSCPDSAELPCVGVVPQVVVEILGESLSPECVYTEDKLRAALGVSSSPTTVTENVSDSPSLSPTGGSVVLIEPLDAESTVAPDMPSEDGTESVVAANSKDVTVFDAEISRCAMSVIGWTRVALSTVMGSLFVVCLW